MTNRNNASHTTANKLFLKLAPRRHSAQFYADDRYMLEAAARFVGAALERGEAGVVIATLDHRAGIAERLERRGLSVIRTREEGRYVEVDADQMLAAVMPAGRLDPIRFAEMLGDTTRRASAAARDEHHRLAVFGEAVSLLCSRGEHEAALQLEQLWNDLSQT